MIRSTVRVIVSQFKHGTGKSVNNAMLTDSLGVLVGLTLSGSTGVLAVVGELVREAVGSNGIGVDDRSTTTSDHRPDATLSVEDSELQRGTSGSVELLDVRLLLSQVTTERSGPNL